MMLKKDFDLKGTLLIKYFPTKKLRPSSNLVHISNKLKYKVQKDLILVRLGYLERYG